jgi:hypothetical protein
VLDPGSDIDTAARPVQRRVLLQALVRTVAVILPDVFGQHLAEMPLAEDHHVIQALAAERAHEPLRVGIRPPRPDRRVDNPRAVPGEDAVECAVNLPSRSRITNLNRPARSPRSISRFLACWAGSGRMRGHARDVHARVWISITNKTYTRRSSTVSTCRKSQAEMPEAWAVRNCREVGDARRVAGPSPAAARILRIVPSPIRQPRPSSSTLDPTVMPNSA